MEFRFPDVGEGITEGEIVRWLVKEGEKVKEDQPLVEVETDKAIVEIPAPKAGTILKLHYKEGETVKVGSVLVTLGEEGAAPGAAKAEEARRPSTTVVGVLEEAEEEVAKPEEKAAVEKKEAERPVQATPAARRLAKELGVDLAQVQGSGPGGAVTEGDVRTAAEKKPAVKVTKKYDVYGYIERIPLKGIRKATARRMAESWEKIPRVTHMDEADVTTLVRLREKAKKEAEGKGVKLTYLPFMIKACIAALKEYPYLNATLEEEKEEIILKKYYNIGIATDIGEGLMVPVVKGADQKPIFEIAREIEALAKAAQARTIDLADLKGGTFTITNIGVIGGTYATPIVNYPEVAILATGKIHEKPVVREGKVEVRKVLPLSLSFDHRVADGAYAARFVTRLIEYLENPGLLFLEK